jgi:hypothetical protein
LAVTRHARSTVLLLTLAPLLATCAGSASPLGDAADAARGDLLFPDSGPAPVELGPGREWGVGSETGPGSEAGPGPEAGPVPDAAPPPPGCADGKKNGSETDVDCGGGTCGPCAAGKACAAHSDCKVNLCAAGTCVTDPLARAFAGQAVFVKDATGLGASYGLHFLSLNTVGSTIYVHYIDNILIGTWRSRVGLATSTDAKTFVKQGVALDIGGSWETVYDAKTQLSHNTGEAEADGWSASTAKHAAGHMCYGPYVTLPTTAPRIVSFNLMVDSTADHTQAVNIEVNDATTMTMVAQKTLYRDDFSAALVYQIFNLGFTPVSGHSYEFRVYWYDTTYTKVKQVALSTGKEPLWDDRLASFPGATVVGSTWYLAYEGAGLSPSWPGDVGLVTSTDPKAFVRSSAVPFLTHQSTGWEKANIGTPSLHAEGGTLYLFYHGFDGTDVQIGVASFTPGSAPVRGPANPILATSQSGWDSGTVGKRSHLLKEGAYYYMAYEGSTDQPFDKAQWSSGLARSASLLSGWQKCPYNPVLPVTAGGFGNDGPELLRFGERIYLYVRQGPNATDRYVLQGK